MSFSITMPQEILFRSLCCIRAQDTAVGPLDSVPNTHSTLCEFLSCKACSQVAQYYSMLWRSSIHGSCVPHMTGLTKTFIWSLWAMRHNSVFNRLLLGILSLQGNPRSSVTKRFSVTETYFTFSECFCNFIWTDRWLFKIFLRFISFLQKCWARWIFTSKFLICWKVRIASFFVQIYPFMFLRYKYLDATLVQGTPIYICQHVRTKSSSFIMTQNYYKLFRVKYLAQ
jgi:hypothetical protein